MAEYTEIVIDWEQRKKWNASEFKSLHNRNVLYQIYCDSHIYGRDVLAYIGQTSRTFEERLKEHTEKSFFQYTNNLNYSVGQLENKYYEDYLKIPESILIANHKPFFNKNYLHDLPSNAKEHKIIIINNGNHGMLKNSCTNYWWVDKNQ